MLQVTKLSKKDFQNPPELREKSQILLMNKNVHLRLHKFCLYTCQNKTKICLYIVKEITNMWAEIK